MDGSKQQSLELDLHGLPVDEDVTRYGSSPPNPPSKDFALYFRRRGCASADDEELPPKLKWASADDDETVQGQARGDGGHQLRRTIS